MSNGSLCSQDPTWQVNLPIFASSLAGFNGTYGQLYTCRSRHIGVRDRIFTRVGASDDLARGRSTFMVEMQETAQILHAATSKV